MTKTGYIVVAILLLGGGEVARRAATFEDAFAATQERMTTQNAADTVAPEVNGRGVQLLASLPIIGRPIETDLERQRAPRCLLARRLPRRRPFRSGERDESGEGRTTGRWRHPLHCGECDLPRSDAATCE
jgi:hypothetical protein